LFTSHQIKIYFVDQATNVIKTGQNNDFASYHTEQIL